MVAKITQEEYSKRLKKFGLVEAVEEYQGTSISILHRCLEHDFVGLQHPISAMRGAKMQACPKCKRVRSKETIEKAKASMQSGAAKRFIKNAKNLYGDANDYSEIDYKGSDHKVQIICRLHGPFWQSPHQHLRGKIGCTKCMVEKYGPPRLFSQAEHIKQVEEGGLLEVIGSYKGARERILYRCKKHDVKFFAWPRNAVQGKGCPECKNLYIKNSLRTPVDILKERFLEKHGSKYAYNFENYVNFSSQIEITCPVHGLFRQRIKDHLKGKGCIKCGNLETGKKLGLDLNGKKIGKLTVLRQVERPESNKQQGTYWLVKCVCGSKPFVVIGYALNNSNTAQCRKCSFRSTAKSHLEREPFPEGMTFGQLTVIREWGRNAKGNRLALCDCECGNQSISQLELLRSGMVKSCGCLAGTGGDSKQRFISDKEWADSPCHFYVANILDLYFKPGIARNTDNRARNGGGAYSNFLFVSPLLCRCEAWAIEQRILKLTRDASIEAESSGVLEFAGYSELRDRDSYSVDWYRHAFYELLEELSDVGWERL